MRQLRLGDFGLDDLARLDLTVARPEHKPFDATPQFYLPPTSGTRNGKPVLDWDGAADQILRGSTGWVPTLGQSVTISYAFRSTAPTTMPEEVTGFQRFNAAQIAFAEQALALWAEVANITFVRVGAGTTGEAAYSNNATILFSNYSAATFEASAFAYLPSPGNTAFNLPDGDVWVDARDAYNLAPALGGFGPHVLTHEIGHAIGLPHPGEYNGYEGGAPTYQNDAEYWQDSRMFTVMSYFAGSNTGAVIPYGVGPHLHDIAAAQMLYGANMNTRTGDTVYGFNSNAGSRYLITTNNQSVVFSIWDAGGTDTLDFSGFHVITHMDLREESFSSGGLWTYNISIARGAVIENAIGGSNDDVIIGNDGNNVLDGRAGNDQLTGGLGNDTYYVDAGDTVNENHNEGYDIIYSSAANYQIGGAEELILLGSGLNGTGSFNADIITGNANANTLEGREGADTLTGNGGNDVLNGGPGADILDGGEGADTASYQNASVGVQASLVAGGLAGDAAGDVFISIEHLTGSGQGDVLIGNGAANRLDGAWGDDVLLGGAGADILIGSVGIDMVTYWTATSGVIVNLITNVGAGGDAAGDTYSEVENVEGSAYDDVLTGDTFSNRLLGAGGNDVLDGGIGGDLMVGNAGDDTYYVDNLNDNTFEGLSGAPGGVDIVRSTIGWAIANNIENLVLLGTADWGVGNTAANVLTGNASVNTLYGLDGDDIIDGGAGADLLLGHQGNDTYYVDSAGDNPYEGNAAWGVDTVIASLGWTLFINLENLVLTGSADFGTGNSLNNTITGTSGVNQLYGLEGDDVLNGGAGADLMIGHQGNDTYYVDNAGDHVYEGNAAWGIDTIVSSLGWTLGAHLENLTLIGAATYGTGNALDNTIIGHTGVNQLYGFEGNDTLDGGAGADTMIGHAGDDTYMVDDASDFVYEGLAGAAGGTDEIRASVNWTLGANFENLTLTGSAISGFGNGVVNTLIGNAAGNTLDGAGGNDTLTGNGGDDTFIFRINDGADVVTDFTAGAGVGDVLRVLGFGAAFDSYAEMIAAGSQVGADVVFNFGNGQTLTLNSVTLGNLVADDFLFV